jgi:hypothetical protein
VVARYLAHPPPIPPGALSYFDAYPRALAADIAAAVASPDAPALIDGAGPAAAENRWAAACVDRARGRLQQDPGLIEQAAQAFADIDARFEEACTLLLLPTKPPAPAACSPTWTARRRRERHPLTPAASGGQSG